MIDVVLLVLRLTLGLFLAAHGAQKLFGLFGGHGLAGTAGFFGGLGLRPAPLWALAAGLSEFGGGLSIALGLLTPLGAIAAAAAMVMAIALAHWPKILVTENGLEYPFVLVVSVLAIGLVGPGALSLDAALGLSLPPALSLGVAAVALLAIVAALATRRVPAAAGQGAD